MLNDKNNNCGNSCEQKKVDAFIDSVEEEIRNENWQRLWNKYGKIITGVSVVFLIGAGVYGMWQRQDLADREAISTRFSLLQNAIMSGNVDGYISQLRELSNVSKKDYAVLAKFEYAAVLRNKQDSAAIDQYKSIFEDAKVNGILKELAYMLYVNTCLDLMPAGELSKSIDGFIKELSEKYINGFWPLIAKESLSFCYIKCGKKELARNTLESMLKTSGIPAGMAHRTKVVLNSLDL